MHLAPGLAQRGQGVPLPLEGARAVGGEKAPAAAQPALDLVLADEAFDEFARRPRLAIDAARHVLAVTLRQVGQGGLGHVAQRAGGPGGVAIADRRGFQHRDVAARPRQRECRRKPGVAAADDGDIGFPDRIGRRRLEWLEAGIPVRIGGESVGEEVGRHFAETRGLEAGAVRVSYALIEGSEPQCACGRNRRQTRDRSSRRTLQSAPGWRMMAVRHRPRIAAIGGDRWQLRLTLNPS